MESEERPVSLVEDYLGMGRRPLYILLAIVACVLVATTGIFISIYGFQHWKTNMSRAGSAMVINFDPQAASPAAAEYVCPNCGVIKTPMWSTNGAPLCPICGMQLSVKQ